MPANRITESDLHELACKIALTHYSRCWASRTWGTREDACQEAYAHALAMIRGGTFDPRAKGASLRAWLAVGIRRHLTENFYGRGLIHVPSSAFKQGSPYTEQAAAAKRRTKELYDNKAEASTEEARDLQLDAQEALAKLPEKERRLVQLHLFDGRSFKSLASEFGLTAQQIGKRYKQAIEGLKK